MRNRLFSTAALAAMLSCAACQPGAMLNLPTGTQGAAPASQQNAAVLTGKVMVPAGIIAPGGGNIIAPGGGNYHVLAGETLEEAPLTDGEVYLADTAGDPLPGFKAVKLDEKGRYTIPDVKAGYTFVVVAKAKGKDGKDVLFQTVAKATELGATADMDAATTLVTAGLVAEADGSLGNFNAFKFKTAAEATKKNLRRDNLPDFGDRAAVLAKIRALSEQVAEIRSALEEIKQELDQVKAQLADLKSQLEQAMAGGPQGGPEDCGKFFEHLDGDGNGRVTLTEWTERFQMGEGDRENPREIFIFVDRNADGVLTSEEFVPECEKHQAQQDSGQQGSCEDGFRFMDQDRSGSLDLEEFRRGHRPPPDVSAPSAEQIFKDLDRDRDGRLSEQEFIEGCSRRDDGPRPPEGPMDCEQQFVGMDRSRDDIVDAAEFKEGFRPAPGETITAEEVMRHMDRNRDGRLDRFEFTEACNGAQNPPPPPSEELSCEEKFGVHDPNRDGVIVMDELRSTVRTDAGAPPADEIFKAWDRDGDGKITRDEYVSAFCNGDPQPATGATGCEEEFKRIDADGDGRIYAREAERLVKERDLNGDAFVDPAEFCGR